MRSSTLIAVALTLLGSATAKFHHNCGCVSATGYDKDLTRRACDLWASLGNPNTHFDGYSCVDKGRGRGIDGDPWETNCRNTYEQQDGGVRNKCFGRCWHDT